MAKELTVMKVPGSENPADLMTKHLDASTMVRHLEALDFFFVDGRANAAPSLCSVVLIDNDRPAAVNPILSPSVGPGGEHAMGSDCALGSKQVKDEWVDGGVVHTRLHHRERRELFTPLRVAGAGPARSLFSIRVTNGVFSGSGQHFRIIDSWTCRASAHQALKEPWTGSTVFIRKSENEHGARSDMRSAGILASAAVPVGGSEFCSASYPLSLRNSSCLSRNCSCNAGNRSCNAAVCGIECLFDNLDNAAVLTSTYSPRTGSEVPIRTPLRSGTRRNTACNIGTAFANIDFHDAYGFRSKC